MRIFHDDDVFAIVSFAKVFLKDNIHTYATTILFNS